MFVGQLKQEKETTTEPMIWLLVNIVYVRGDVCCHGNLICNAWVTGPREQGLLVIRVYLLYVPVNVFVSICYELFSRIVDAIGIGNKLLLYENKDTATNQEKVDTSLIKLRLG